MDLRRLRAGELVTGVGAIALAVVMLGDWFGGRSAWQALPVGSLLLGAVVLLALTVVALTVLARPVAMTVSAAVITTAVSLPVALYLLVRVGIDEPGRNGAVAIDLGAYLGVVALLAIVGGVVRTMADERTRSAHSLRQTERVLAVRGAPRTPPPPRSADRGTRAR